MSSRAVLVTGGATGIGLATTAAFLDNGDRVAVCQHDAADIDAHRGELDCHSSRASPVLADLATDEGCRRGEE